MPRVCKVCTHPQVAEVNRLMVQGVPVRHIAARFQLSPTAVQRHKKHIGNLMNEQREKTKMDVRKEMETVLRSLTGVALRARGNAVQ